MSDHPWNTTSAPQPVNLGTAEVPPPATDASTPRAVVRLLAVELEQVEREREQFRNAALAFQARLTLAEALLRKVWGTVQLSAPLACEIDEFLDEPPKPRTLSWRASVHEPIRRTDDADT